MSSLFAAPKVPEVRQTVSALPAAPERTSAQTSALADAQRAKFFDRAGRESTMLTGGAGTSGGLSAVRYLGGAART